MMRVLLIIGVIGVILYALNGKKIRKQLRDPKVMRKYLAGFAVLLVLLLIASGRLHWLTGIVAAAFAALLPMLRAVGPLLVRFFPLFQQLYHQRQATQQTSGNQSQVSTRILAMSLDHDSGELEGKVLDGPFKDAELADLTLEQLRELSAYCQSEDAESAQLLDSYLDRRFTDEWREPSAQREREAGSDLGSGLGGELSRREALAILGLGDAASREEIIAAHRQLMQKIHPDRGGSDYLAAKVNQAKSVLLP